MSAHTTGHHAAASTTGRNAAASTTGHHAAASTTGHHAAASTTGRNAAASTTGYHAAASTTGYHAAASTTGHHAAASTTGDSAAASTTGDSAAASTTGRGAVAVAVNGPAESQRHIAVGRWVRLTETSNAAVVLPDSPGWEPCVVSGRDGWRAGVWITMQDGEIVERPDVLALDGRGYMLTHEDGRYVAGCRNFTAAEAIEHWSNPDHEAPESAAVLLAAVIENEAAQ